MSLGAPSRQLLGSQHTANGAGERGPVLQRCPQRFDPARRQVVVAPSGPLTCLGACVVRLPCAFNQLVTLEGMEQWIDGGVLEGEVALAAFAQSFGKFVAVAR